MKKEKAYDLVEKHLCAILDVDEVDIISNDPDLDSIIQQYANVYENDLRNYYSLVTGLKLGLRLAMSGGIDDGKRKDS